MTMKNHSDLEHVGSILLRVLDSIPNLAALGRLSAGISVNMPRHATNDSQAIPRHQPDAEIPCGASCGAEGQAKEVA